MKSTLPCGFSSFHACCPGGVRASLEIVVERHVRGDERQVRFASRVVGDRLAAALHGGGIVAATSFNVVKRPAIVQCRHETLHVLQRVRKRLVLNAAIFEPNFLGYFGLSLGEVLPFSPEAKID